MSLSRFTLLFVLLTAAWTLRAQCPGCVTNLPTGLPADTIFMGVAPDGQVGVPYDEDISFRLPVTTTPVAAVDPTVPAGLPITEINILSVSNLPPGLSWEASKLNFATGSGDTDGCVKFCGVPTLADSFFIQVTASANIFGIVQTANFNIRMYIAPASVVNQGFAMENNVGCGQTTVSFTNNVPSNGLAGFSYLWDFGNGNTTTQEDPGPQTYDQPGAYPVSYSATIDTSDFYLTAVTVVSTDCNDFNIPPNDKPDLFIRVKSPGGSTIYTSPVASNVDVPYTFYLNLVIGSGNYAIEVLDDELIGTEECGSVNFSQTTTGILSDGPLKVSLNINHPILTVNTVDTVYVYPIPDAPILDYETLEYCEGDLAELSLVNYSSGILWYQDSVSIPGANGTTLMASVPGDYWAVYTSPDGCSAQSDPVTLIFHALPALPVFTNDNNLLSVNPDLLPANFILQWYQDGEAIPGATDQSYCMTEEGVFTMALEVTNTLTGCSRTYDHQETFDPDADCTTGVRDEWASANTLRLFPNPASSALNLSIDQLPSGWFDILCMNSLGQVLIRQQVLHDGGAFRHTLAVQGLHNGHHFLLLRSQDGAWVARASFIKTE